MIYNNSPKHIFMLATMLERLRLSADANRVDLYLYSINEYLEYTKSKTYTILIEESGFILGKHVHNDTYGLMMLYVLPEFRGKGVALRLKKELEEYAFNKGYKRIKSCVKTDHFASISLNKKAGWLGEPDKIYPDDYIWFTKELDNWLNDLT